MAVWAWAKEVAGHGRVVVVPPPKCKGWQAGQARGNHLGEGHTVWGKNGREQSYSPPSPKGKPAVVVIGRWCGKCTIGR